MSIWNNLFPGAFIPRNVQTALSGLGALPVEEAQWEELVAKALANGVTMQHRAFYADGTVDEEMPNTVYPRMVASLLDIPTPEAFLEIEPGFSRGAAKAAYTWYIGRKKSIYFPVSSPISSMRDGLVLQRDGYRIAVPLAGLPVTGFNSVDCFAPFGEFVFPVVDTFINDEYWADNSVPSFILPSVYLQRAVLRKAFAGTYLESRAETANVVVVRVTGSLPTDVSFRKVGPDIAEEDRLLETLDEAVAGGKMSRPILVRRRDDWLAEKQAALDEAFKENNLHEDIETLMRLTSLRKQLERDAADAKDERDTAALCICNLMGNAQTGTTKYDGKDWTITQQNPTSRPLTIKPEHARFLLSPKRAAEVITFSEKERVSVDVI